MNKLSGIEFKNLEEMRLYMERQLEPIGFEILENNRVTDVLFLCSRSTNDKFSATYEWFKHYCEQKAFRKKLELEEKRKLERMYR